QDGFDPERRCADLRPPAAGDRCSDSRSRAGGAPRCGEAPRPVARGPRSLWPGRDERLIDIPQFPREIAPNVFWLGGCLGVELEGRIVHGYSSVYLLRGSERTLLVDPGHPMDWAAIASGLDTLLDDRALDYVFPTPPEMPHAGNLGRLLTKYPNAVAIGDMRDFHLYYPAFVDRFVDRSVGTVIDLGDMQFEIVEAIIKDLPNTQWGYESTRRILFVADGFAYVHHPEL